jgi:hypothetical protein
MLLSELSNRHDILHKRPEESYRLWCVSECDQVKIKTLYTYCEQVGRRGRDYELSVLYIKAVYGSPIKLQQ